MWAPLLLGPSLARAQPTQDRKAFFQSDPEVIKSVWHARQLDPSKTLDRRVLEVMTELQSATNVTAPVYWKSGAGSETHPRLGIGLDSTQLLGFLAQDGEEAFQSDLLAVLGHELGHVLQARRYSLESLADSSKARAIEVQADIFAGVNAALVLAAEHRDSSVANRIIRVMATRIASLGSHDYDQSHHPRTEQRARAFATGLVAGFQLLDLRRCSANDQLACARATAGAQRDDQIRDMTEANFWEWSNRLAKNIAQYTGP